MRTALVPVRSTLIKPHRATLSSVVGDHMRNCGAALSFYLVSLSYGVVILEFVGKLPAQTSTMVMLIETRIITPHTLKKKNGRRILTVKILS